MAVGEKAMAWPPLVSPLDVTSGRYSSVFYLDKWHKINSYKLQNSVYPFRFISYFIFVIVLHCEGEPRQ